MTIFLHTKKVMRLLNKILRILSFAVFVHALHLRTSESTMVPTTAVHHIHQKHEALVTQSATVPNREHLAARDMPKIDTLSSSSLSSLTSYSYNVQIPTATNQNPYLLRDSAPRGTTFVAVGVVICVILASFFAFWLISYLCSARRAKIERETYFPNMPLGASFLGANSSDTSSIMEKGSLSSLSSLHKLSSHNSMLQLQQEKEIDTPFKSSRQGHAYRNACNDNRGSMYISPVLDLMSKKAPSLIDLPMTAPNNPTKSNLFYTRDASRPSFYTPTDSGSGSPLYEDVSVMEYSKPADTSYYNDSASHFKSQKPQMSRAPSLYLDDLLDD